MSYHIKCKTVHTITDKNKNWYNTSKPNLQRLREADLMFRRRCSNIGCRSLRCAKCFDLDIVGFRRQYCNREYCERRKSPRWPGAALPLSHSLPVAESFGPRLVDSYGLMKVELPPFQNAFIEECHHFTGQEEHVVE
jgi:hypothetical protein